MPPVTGLPASGRWENTASFTYSGVESTTSNNSSTAILYATSQAPKVTSPVRYGQGEPAVPLTAEGSNLMWYTSLLQPGSTTAPVPSTENIGIKNYYVTQLNGNCESPISIIQVIVEKSTATPVTACDSYTAPDVNIYTTSGMISALTKNSEGNDTTILINLTINNSTTSEINETACDSYIAPDGAIHTFSGVKTAIIPNALGCDSIITIHLTINESPKNTIFVETCDSYTAPDGRYSYYFRH
jgi:hypothetical protein